MVIVSGYRPPQFSENDAWLPVWLQQCDFGQFNVEGIATDYMTFDQRVEEFKVLQKGMSNGGSMREEDRCNIGQLFISGTESSPFSFVQSADNVAQLHLFLSSDVNSDNTILSADASCPPAIRSLHSSPDLVKDANLKYQNSGTFDRSPTAALKKSSKDNEFLRHNRSLSFCEDVADAVELCVAASEALVIKEAIENDIFAPSASAILEASLQVKQARLALLTSATSDIINETSEMDNLSNLDGSAMGSAYDDVGIHFDEFPGNKLSVSQVNDTFDSDHGENLNHKVINASTTASGKSLDLNNAQVMQGIIDTEIKSRNNAGEECFDADMGKKAIGNSKGYLDTDVGNNYNGLETVGNQYPSFSEATIAKNILHETNMSSSLIKGYQAKENNNTVKNVVQERFQSRWLGGWTTMDEEKKFNILTHSIPKHFAAETSFLSESACTAPDENSVMQNHDKGTIIASQLSIPSEELSIAEKGGMFLSQDVASSNTSLVDPLCSVVPCSISGDACSSPPINREDAVCPELLNVTVEHKDDELLEMPYLNHSVAEGEKIVLPVTKIMESRDKVSRTFSSLKNYSKLLPRHTISFKRGSRKKSVFIHRYTGVTFLRTPSVDYEEIAKDRPEVPILKRANNCNQSRVGKGRIEHRLRSLDCSLSNLAEQNANQPARPENKVKFLTNQNQNPQHLLLHNNNCESSTAPKHVHFLEKETSIPNNKRLHNAYTSAKAGSTSVGKRPTRASARLASKAEQMGRFQKKSLNNEKKRLIFQNMEFLLTGFSQQEEEEIEGLIRKYGGNVLSHIPSKKGKRSSKFKRLVPIVLCLKKTQSLKFLYGCAVHASVLKVNWLIDSIAAGVVLPSIRYTILQRSTSKKDDQVQPTQYNTHALVFSNLGVMLHGKTKYSSNIATIIEHGGGKVFKTLQRLIQTLEAGRVSMGVIVLDEENCASRHLKQCASEQNIPVTSIQWILKCLYAGEMIPLEEKKSLHHQPSIILPMDQDPMELSQEI